MDWRFNTIWFDQIPQEILYIKDLKYDSIRKENPEFESSEYAILWHLKEKFKLAFGNLEKAENLKYLELNWANIKNFNGIEKFKNLKRLELHHCIKLESDEGLSRLKESLEVLNIDQSKKIIFSDDFFKLTKLKVLSLNNCGVIENLNFLRYFPQLIDFRFVNTNILDGNIQPILNHPTIKTVGFTDKRHYNIKYDRVIGELKERANQEYKTRVYKGEYSTFRYDYE